MLRRWLAALAVAVAVAASLVAGALPSGSALCLAQPRAVAAPPAGPGASGIAVRTLRNGMKVIVWPDHDIPNVALYFVYRVGSRNERPGITGISHFFEHMMFNGSAQFPGGEFDRLMEAGGGANNAYTSQDVTVYQDWFPRSALDLIFRLEADRICCLSFDSTSVESERGVVSSERRTSVDSDSREALDEQVQATAYLAHPYMIPIIGWPSDIERWAIGDLERYFRTYYAPNNATMVVVGDVTPAEIFGLAERYIEPIPSQPPPPPVETVEPPQNGERRLTLRRPAPAPLLEVVYHAGAADDRDAEAEQLLVSILARGESSRLYRRLVDQDRSAIHVWAGAQAGFDPGLFYFFVTVSPEKGVSAAEAALYEELDRIAREGVSEAELAKAKRIQLAAHWRSLETIDGKADEIGQAEVFLGEYRRLFDAPDRYAKVTQAQIRSLAKRIFAPGNRTVGVVEPVAEPPGASGKGGAR